MIAFVYVFAAGVAMMCIGVTMQSSGPRYNEDRTPRETTTALWGFRVALIGMMLTVAGLGMMMAIAGHIIK
jgi:hypothetical protein